MPAVIVRQKKLQKFWWLCFTTILPSYESQRLRVHRSRIMKHDITFTSKAGPALRRRAMKRCRFAFPDIALQIRFLGSNHMMGGVIGYSPFDCD